MTHVVSDAFANDTEIPDPYWISKFILQRVTNGSIILIHMPEKIVVSETITVNPYVAIEQTLISMLKPKLNRKDVFRNRPRKFTRKKFKK